MQASQPVAMSPRCSEATPRMVAAGCRVCGSRARSRAHEHRGVAVDDPAGAGGRPAAGRPGSARGWPLRAPRPAGRLSPVARRTPAMAPRAGHGQMAQNGQATMAVDAQPDGRTQRAWQCVLGAGRGCRDDVPTAPGREVLPVTLAPASFQHAVHVREHSRHAGVHGADPVPRSARGPARSACSTDSSVRPRRKPAELVVAEVADLLPALAPNRRRGGEDADCRGRSRLEQVAPGLRLRSGRRRAPRRQCGGTTCVAGRGTVAVDDNAARG